MQVLRGGGTIQKPSVGGFDRIAANDDRLPCLFQHPGEGETFGHCVQGFPVGYDNEFPRSPVTGGGGGHSGSYQFVYLFLFYRAILILTYAFAIEYRFQGLVFRFLPLFPVEEQAMRKTVIKKKRQILIKTGLYGFITDYLLNINVEGIFCKASFRCSETSFHVL